MDVSEVLCPTCRAVQPPRVVDHFARLGLERRFAQNMEQIDRSYFKWQRQLHPDRFAAKSGRERAISQQQAAALNEAYEVLRDPVRRASYLAGLTGVDLPSDGKTIADPDLLMEAMESREELMEAHDVEEVDRLAAEASNQLNRNLAELDQLFLRNDRGAIRKAVLRLRYLEKFADEARARRTNLGAAPR
jgi:molecular chaperone HscB